MSQIYFIWSNTLHVSDGLSVHHQEFQIVHTATGVCQTDTAVCLLARRQQCLFDMCLTQYVADVPISQTYFIWSSTLHVSEDLSVHHQEFQTVHTATGICQTDTAICCLLAS